MRVLVPFAAEHPKTRLDDIFDPRERHAFARVMLRDVLRTLDEAGHSPEVLSTAPLDSRMPVTVDERPLSTAVNDALDPPMAVVMADLPLVTPEVVSELFSSAADVVLAPGRGGGTNAMVVRHPDFRVDYHGASYPDHREHARAIGASIETVDSHRLATDIDERADLVEVLIHGTGETRAWLDEARLELETTGGRVRVSREASEDG